MSQSAQQQRALQKEVLLMRSQIERIELVQSVDAVKKSLAPLALLRSAIPQAAAAKGPGVVLELIKRYPWFSAAATVFASRKAGQADARPGIVGRVLNGVKMAAKLTVAAGVSYSAYKAYQVVQGTKTKR